jgi:hypothetical protein
MYEKISVIGFEILLCVGKGECLKLHRTLCAPGTTGRTSVKVTQSR